MTPKTPRPPKPTAVRSPRSPLGFTLVELLIVIMVIGILVALLVPVLASSVRKANEARVSAEINNLGTALSEFKNTYGDYPPSRIMLSEGGLYPVSSTDLLANMVWLGTPNPAAKFGAPDLTVGELANRSLTYLRKFFPKAVFSTTVQLYGSGGQNPAVWHDFNGNGVFDAAPIYLEGHEALAFFLGGIPFHDGTGVVSALSGFSSNPINPFQNSTVAPNRKNASSFEFRADRLRDNDIDGIPGYLDPLGTQGDTNPSHFYAYFSSYAGNSYDPNDINFSETDDMNNLVGQSFSTLRFPTATQSPAPNPYTSTVPVPSNARASFLNAKGFQLFSSGIDGRYGPGGQYIVSGQSDKMPANGVSPEWTKFGSDNISNFSSGRLE